MYYEYFGLAENPFSIAPDPRYLFLSEQHREALAHLLYGVASDGGFVLLTGEVGTGKTTICRCLLEQIPDDCEVAFIFNPKLTVEELLSSICDEFRVEYPAGTQSIKVFVDLINKYLLDAHASGRKAVLIIDEAQNLKSDVLEQIRLLTNLETNQRKLLQIILLGQPELRDKLSRPELRQLAQRIIARYHLGPLNSREVAAYVNHRLTVAGARRLLFPLPSLTLLHRLSRGIPRLINVLCDRALLGSYAQGKESVDRATLARAAKEVLGEARSSRESYKKVAFRSLAVLLTLASGALMAAAYYHYRPHPAETAVAFPEKVQRTAAPSSEASPPLKSLPSESRKSASTEAKKRAAAKPDQPESSEENMTLPARIEDGKPAAPLQTTPQPAAKPASKGISSLSSQKTEEIVKPEPPKELIKPATQPVQLAKLTWQTEEPITDSKVLATLALFEQWGADYKPDFSISACQQAQTQNLECLSGKASLVDLRRFNRPAVLKLYDGQSREFYATLTGLQGQQARFVVGAKQITVSADEIALAWLGDYTLLWRAPPDYQGIIKEGDQGPQVAWLQQQLLKAQGKPAGSQTNVRYDEAMAREVKRFQLINGLQPDGIVGPQTLILLNTAVGSRTPRLIQNK